MSNRRRNDRYDDRYDDHPRRRSAKAGGTVGGVVAIILAAMALGGHPQGAGGNHNVPVPKSTVCNQYFRGGC